MREAALTTALAAVATATAAASPPADYVWSIADYQAGLSHGNPHAPPTAGYRFTVAGPRTRTADRAGIPAFRAACSGLAAGFPLASAFAACDAAAATTDPSGGGGAVAARVVPSDDGTRAHIAISYAFASGDEAHNLTALVVTDWAGERAPYNLTVTPAEGE
ncbi:hypothetical protein F4780DRAFT_785204 [Xylariomycetidae sp. FL0641]|nr:hypothetical protein F4780DRAFT_785204 [Xylariomycetidae sp. FL0641]